MTKALLSPVLEAYLQWKRGYQPKNDPVADHIETFIGGWKAREEVMIKPPAEIQWAITKIQQARNARELADYCEKAGEHDLTAPGTFSDEVYDWALTATEENSTPDELTVAKIILEHHRSRMQNLGVSHDPARSPD